MPSQLRSGKAERVRAREEQAQIETLAGPGHRQVDDVMEAWEDDLALLSEPGEAYAYDMSDRPSARSSTGPSLSAS